MITKRQLAMANHMEAAVSPKIEEAWDVHLAHLSVTKRIPVIRAMTEVLMKRPEMKAIGDDFEVNGPPILDELIDRVIKRRLSTMARFN